MNVLCDLCSKMTLSYYVICSAAETEIFMGKVKQRSFFVLRYRGFF